MELVIDILFVNLIDMDIVIVECVVCVFFVLSLFEIWIL